jgi:outer membrane protein assembly factor BamB
MALTVLFAGCAGSDESDWTDWRGAERRGQSPHVPEHLPTTAKKLWKRPLTGLGLAGIVANSKIVIVPDKSADKRRDIWRGLAADTGRQLWTVEYDAAGDMDYSNAARATPVIHGDRAYLLGAFGHLYCVRWKTGDVVWKRHLVTEFSAELPTWGMSASPLVVGNKLIVNPGGKDASLAALDLETGRTIWTTPGEPAAYASLILATLGGVEQIVGYDAVSVGGWDARTGSRLWTLEPPEPNDFNVPTPVELDGRLLLTSENNGTRLYEFDSDGRIRSEPVARNDDLVSDSSTPVVAGGRIFGIGYRFVCLDASSLKTLWQAEGDGFDYASLIAGGGRVLVTTVDGELILFRADAAGLTNAEHLKPFGDEAEVWSHPALTAGRLYLRSDKAVCCLLLD